MKTADRFRQNAENCLQLAERSTSEPLSKRYLRMAESWKALADEQDWLDGEISLSVPAHLSGEARPQ